MHACVQTYSECCMLTYVHVCVQINPEHHVFCHVRVCVQINPEHFVFSNVHVCVQINPEHYVFSSFGVLHVYPDQPAESMTLAQWQRAAVLWKAVASIPFFKYFLVRKAFKWWVGTETRNESLMLCFVVFLSVVSMCIIKFSFLKTGEVLSLSYSRQKIQMCTNISHWCV